MNDYSHMPRPGFSDELQEQIHGRDWKIRAANTRISIAVAELAQDQKQLHEAVNEADRGHRSKCKSCNGSGNA